ncbi:MAG: FAD-dependent oxidoreductase [Rhodospirillales bacterium]|nr:FAD-dependent oxidoreductase [Rhodospirillales bacterium]
MSLSIAIIGSGPAGFYTADALTSACPDCRVDFIERLPTPFGLIRGGVAPDHQTTKRVTKKYENTAMMEQVNFYGNVEIGRDLSLDELRTMYDAVVLAIGAPADKKLTIPGADKIGVHGSAAFVGWYNGHPDFRDLEPDLNTNAAVVIGNGNVAIDVARVLLRSPDGMADSDLPDHVASRIHAAPITDVHVVGRRGPADAKFTNVELREMGNLNMTHPCVKADQLPDDLDTVLAGYAERDRRLRARNIETLREFAALENQGKPKKVHFEFFATPVEIMGGERVEAIRFERTTVEDGKCLGSGQFFDIECGLVIPSIGYRSEPLAGAPFDDKQGIIPNDNGRIAPGLYAVGWIKRGPSGVISSNRPDGNIVAEYIAEDITADPKRTGRDRLEAVLKERHVRWVDYADWKKLEAMEIENAAGKAPRKKFVTVDDMIHALDGFPN